MTSFRYKAVRANGEMVEGDLEATSKAQVMTRLSDMGYMPISAAAVGGSALSRLLAADLFGGDRMDLRDLMIASRELATLLDAGIELERALEILVALAERPVVQRTFAAVLDDVRGGSALGDALDARGGTFPISYVSMVRAGEIGGSLAVVIGRLSDYLERAQAARETVRSALIYPIILLVMALASVIVMVSVVLPQFTPLFEGAGAELPLLTQGLLALSNFIERAWWALLLGIIALTVVIRRRLAVPEARLRFHRRLLDVPLLRDLILRVETARLTRTLGTLLQNGVATIDALAIARETVVNRHFNRALGEVGDKVKSGATIAQALGEVPRFPTLAAHLVRVGEETGRLESMLLRTADLFEEETQRAIRRMLGLLVPGLTAALGVVVAVIIASVFMAIIRVNQLAI